jgi:hypothetical protein
VRSPVPQITTYVLLVHMLLGCCAHHAHACESHCCSSPAASASACPCGTHEQDSAIAETMNGDAVGFVAKSGRQREAHHCEGAACTFLRSQSLSQQLDPFLADVCAPAAVAGPSAADACSSLWARPLAELSIGGPPLRVHLLLRVLLI